MSADQITGPYIRPALRDAPQKADPPTEGALRHRGLDTSNIRLMGLNESLFPPSPKVIEAVRNNVDKMNLYPDAQCPALSDIVSARTGVSRDCIIWGNGSEELLKGAIDLSLSPGEGLVLPVPVYRPDPEFPDLARQIRKSGRVILHAVVDEAGNVGEIEVIYAPDPDFGYSEEAIRAVRNWRYQPGQLGGRAVPVRLTVRVDFELH